MHRTARRRSATSSTATSSAAGASATTVRAEGVRSRVVRSAIVVHTLSSSTSRSTRSTPSSACRLDARVGRGHGDGRRRPTWSPRGWRSASSASTHTSRAGSACRAARVGRGCCGSSSGCCAGHGTGTPTWRPDPRGRSSRSVPGLDMAAMRQTTICPLWAVGGQRRSSRRYKMYRDQFEHYVESVRPMDADPTARVPRCSNVHAVRAVHELSPRPDSDVRHPGGRVAGS